LPYYNADGIDKSSLAYSTGKKHIGMEGIAQDALIMNIDDLLCVGTTIIFCFLLPLVEIKV
jgi:phosphoribosylaminoimidazole (AIR) synthetase